jgi:hypothetical protein
LPPFLTREGQPAPRQNSDDGYDEIFFFFFFFFFLTPHLPSSFACSAWGVEGWMVAGNLVFCLSIYVWGYFVGLFSLFFSRGVLAGLGFCSVILGGLVFSAGFVFCWVTGYLLLRFFYLRWVFGLAWPVGIAMDGMGWDGNEGWMDGWNWVWDGYGLDWVQELG